MFKLGFKLRPCELPAVRQTGQPLSHYIYFLLGSIFSRYKKIAAINVCGFNLLSY